MQEPYEDLYPEKLYDQVGTHELFRMIISFAGHKNLLWKAQTYPERICKEKWTSTSLCRRQPTRAVF